jgi:hypothetical protein
MRNRQLVKQLMEGGEYRHEGTEGHIMTSSNLTSLLCNEPDAGLEMMPPNFKNEDIIVCCVVGLSHTSEGGDRRVWSNGRNMINGRNPVPAPFCPQSHIKSPGIEI